MFDFTRDELHNRSSALYDLRMFVRGRRDALFKAAALLGGTPGMRLAHAALDGLTKRDAPSRRTIRLLDEFLDLLLLKHVHHSSRIEAGRFAAINPFDPCVEEICLLGDGLEEVIAAYRDYTSVEPEIAAAEVAA